MTRGGILYSRRRTMTIDGSQHICKLGDELLGLVRGIAAPLTDITPLTGVGYPGYTPTAFRLRFADGLVLKGRRCATAEQAALVEHVVQRLCRDHFPAVVARAGAALLTEWIDGRCLEPAAWPADLLTRCGALHATMHNLPLPADLPARTRNPLAARYAELQNKLAHLVAAGVVHSREADVVHDVAAHAMPRSCTVGYVHGDFCAENLVLRPSGDVGVVDNETLGIDAHDFDLGRTWYRWPMRAAQRRAYLNGYRQHRDAGDFLRHFPFWAIGAVLRGAVFRLHKSAAGPVFPLARLRDLVKMLEAGTGAEDAVFRW